VIARVRHRPQADRAEHNEMLHAGEVGGSVSEDAESLV